MATTRRNDEAEETHKTLPAFEILQRRAAG
jgi:hypothetical protein